MAPVWEQSNLYERPPKPRTIRNSFTRTLVLDTIMKLSGTIGVTQKTMTLIHMLADFWIWRHSSGKLISARNEASKNIQKLCTKNKRYHAQDEHTSKIRKWKAAQNDDQNDDRTMTIFLVSESLQTHPRREPKMLSLLVRNYSIIFYSYSLLLLLLLLFLLLLLVLLLLLLFVSITCSFHVHEHQTLRNDRGHTKNDDHFSHVLSRM